MGKFIYKKEEPKVQAFESYNKEKLQEFCQLLTLSQKELADFIISEIPRDFYRIERHEKAIIAVPKNPNLYAKVPTFSSHLDIVGCKPPTLNELEIKDAIISLKPNAKASVLGGDDRCGVYIMLELMKTHKNAIFAFFYDEEIGCVGSRLHCNLSVFKNTNAFIGLDRRGINDCATYGTDSFALIDTAFALGYTEAWGSVTDVAVLAEHWQTPCINLSVGFNSEHTKQEWVDFSVTERTLEICKNLAIEGQEFEVDLRPDSYLGYDYKYDDGLYDEWGDIPLEPVFCEICGADCNLYKYDNGYICADCYLKLFEEK